MEIVFLGTSSMVPTKERNQSALLISYGSEGILVDCGEGTQRQLKIAGISPAKITKILITHWHGDHVLGLPGLIQTMSSFDIEQQLDIYGPEGTQRQLEHLKKAFLMEENRGGLKVSGNEVSEKRFFEGREFALEAMRLDHTAPCLGYSLVEKDKRKIDLDKAKKFGLQPGPLLGQLQEGKTVSWKGKTVKPEDVSHVAKGKKVTVISDTKLCKACTELAEGADVLICEATYSNDLEEKAELYKHLTAQQAALIANNAGAKRLILTHFSQRYKNVQQIEEEARTVFDNVICAHDFMKINV